MFKAEELVEASVKFHYFYYIVFQTEDFPASLFGVSCEYRENIEVIHPKNHYY
jgi:hypothetical protein